MLMKWIDLEIGDVLRVTKISQNFYGTKWWGHIYNKDLVIVSMYIYRDGNNNKIGLVFNNSISIFIEFDGRLANTHREEPVFFEVKGLSGIC